MKRIGAVLVLCLLSGAAQRVRGEDAVFLSKREITTSMFIIGLSNDGAELTGLRLAYIPPELQSRCWTHSVSDCKAIVQKAGNFVSSGPLPGKFYEVSVSLSDGSDRSKTVLASAAKNAFISNYLQTAEKGPRDTELPTIERAVKLRALVRWEGWTNGDSIKRVIEIP